MSFWLFKVCQYNSKLVVECDFRTFSFWNFTTDAQARHRYRENVVLPPAADETSSFRCSRAPTARPVRVNLSSDDKIDGFWTFALFVRLNVETDPLPLV
jgi:hypothetical protein